MSSVPSIDDYITSFPYAQLPKIIGPPTYESLKDTRDLLKINAASVPTTRGGGQHGYLALVLPGATYNTLVGAANAFVPPTNPGETPTIPRNAVGSAIAELE